MVNHKLKYSVIGVMLFLQGSNAAAEADPIALSIDHRDRNRSIVAFGLQQESTQNNKPEFFSTISIIEPSDDEWIKANSKIVFSLKGGAVPTNTPVFFIGSTDVTALFYESGPGEYSSHTSSVHFPTGASELIIFDRNGENWSELGRVPIKILTTSGFEAIVTAPQLDITFDSQLSDGRSGELEEPDRGNYNDVSLQAGFSSEQARNQLQINSEFNLIGASNREQALRFSEENDNANKIDLADYLFEIKSDKTRISLGHITYGQHPLLVNSVANRGLSVNHKLNSRIDFSLASQNATDIVGFSNPFGLGNSGHSLNNVAMGYEMYPLRPGALRIEASYVDAAVQTENNFDIGEIPINEKSNGWGIRLLGASPSDRLRGQFNFARADYTNPADDELFQDQAVVKPSTDDARSAELSYDFLQDKTFGDDLSTTLTVTIRHEQTDPLYKTLAAFPNADVRQNTGIIASQVGLIGMELQHVSSIDNLDNIASILKTETKSTMFLMSAPLSEIFGDKDNQNIYWPSATLNVARIHQRAVNRPVEEDSEFNSDSDLPDQEDLSTGLELSWTFEQWNLANLLTTSNQDNRQIGRENSDFRSFGNELSLQYLFNDSFELGVTLGRNRDRNLEENLKSYNDLAGINIRWDINENWGLAGQILRTINTDSADNAKNDNESSDFQVIRRFQIPFPDGSKRNGQFFIRYNNQNSLFRDTLFEINSQSRNWVLTSGLSFSLF